MKRFHFTAIVLTLLASTACSGSGAVSPEGDAAVEDARSAEEGPDTSTPCEATAILQVSCLQSGCHNAADKTAGLDLETRGVVARYREVPTKGGGAAHALIDPESPEKSAIYTKTLTPPPFGLQMPMAGSRLTAEQQACIASWLTSELASADR